MKLNELQKDTNLTQVKVKIPTNVLEQMRKLQGEEVEDEMFIASATMGEFWLSPNPPNAGSRRLFFLQSPYVPADILGWEVAE